MSIISAHAEPTSDELQIKSIREQSNRAITEHDVKSILSSLDNKFQMTTGSGLFLRGITETNNAFTDIFAKFNDIIYVRTPEKIEISSYKPIASETGKWIGTWTSPKGPVRMEGRYSAYWHKSDGHWKIRSEQFVTLNCKGSGC